MRALIFLALAAACAPVLSQNGPQGAPSLPGALQKEEQAADGRRNQRIERIVVEDAGARIDELRVGGQAQSVTVQPKAGVPAYEMQPIDLARSRPADNRDGLSSATGRRVWNVFRY